MTRDALKVLPFLLLFAPGCPGGMDVSNLPPGHVDGGTPGQPFTYSDTSQVSAPLTADLGAPLTPDSGAQAAPDMTAPAPDTLPPPQTGVTPPPGTGQPCPCAGGLVCVNGACRATCTPPTDACKAVASCAATEACLPTTGGFSVCVPATATPGGTCDASKWCPVSYVCGSVGGSGYKCLPTCTGANTACGTGGTCVLASNGCTFCSSL